MGGDALPLLVVRFLSSYMADTVDERDLNLLNSDMKLRVLGQDLKVTSESLRQSHICDALMYLGLHIL